MTQYCVGTIVFALALTLPAALLAQNFARGSIGGAVYDTSGGILPDARLTLTSEYGVRETKAGPDGTYRFASLEPGKHTLKAAYPNFKTTEIKDIEVRLNERTNIEVKLEAGVIESNHHGNRDRRGHRHHVDYFRWHHYCGPVQEHARGPQHH